MNIDNLVNNFHSERLVAPCDTKRLAHLVRMREVLAIKRQQRIDSLVEYMKKVKVSSTSSIAAEFGWSVSCVNIYVKEIECLQRTRRVVISYMGNL